MLDSVCVMYCCFFFSSRRRHTRFALVTGVQTCALPISVDVRALAVGRPESEEIIIGALMLVTEDQLRLLRRRHHALIFEAQIGARIAVIGRRPAHEIIIAFVAHPRSEEHTSELQSLMRISYAVFCLKKKNNNNNATQHTTTTRPKP